MSKVGNVVRLNFLSLKRNEVHSFNNRVLHILDETCGACGKTYDDFKAAAEQYGALLYEKGFAPSLALDEYDRRADEAWRGLDLQISASLKHPQEDVRKAAQAVSDVFSKTPNPTYLNYDQEYGTLSVLLSQLKAIDSAVLETARVDAYIAYLDTCVHDFVEASNKSIDAKSRQQVGAIRAAMQLCHKAWQNLAKYLEAMSLAEALPGVNDAIDQLNAMNAAIKRRLNVRKTSQANEGEAEANVNIVEQEDESKLGQIS